MGSVVCAFCVAFLKKTTEWSQQSSGPQPLAVPARQEFPFVFLSQEFGFVARGYILWFSPPVAGFIPNRPHVCCESNLSV